MKKLSILAAAGLGAFLTAPALASERLTATFTQRDGVTVNTHDNVVLVTVSGVGQSWGISHNDAFYVYADTSGAPIGPTNDQYYYQLTFGASPLAMPTIPTAQAERHRWTEGDDLVALYMSRYGAARLPMMQAAIASRLGMSEASLIMRQRNFGYLDNGVGLSHVAAQTRRIHRQYRNATEAELRPLVLRVLNGPQSP